MRRLLRAFFGPSAKRTDSSKFFTKDLFAGHPNVTIGDYSYGNPQVLFADAAHLEIGKFCSIASDVTIFLGGNHRTDWISTYPFNVVFAETKAAGEVKGHPATKGDVIIGNDVWIGFGATILSGVSIADGAVIAARAVVTKNIGPYEIWGGNPARLISKRFTDLDIKKLQELQWWDWPLDKILNCAPILCSSDRSGLFKNL